MAIPPKSVDFLGERQASLCLLLPQTKGLSKDSKHLKCLRGVYTGECQMTWSILGRRILFIGLMRPQTPKGRQHHI